MFDLDAHKDKVRLVPNDDFEDIQLVDNYVRLMKIGSSFPFNVKYTLIECIEENTNLFAISPYEMPSINPTMACQQLNIDPGA